MSMSRAAPADAVMHSAQRGSSRGLALGTTLDCARLQVCFPYTRSDRLNYSVSSREQLRVSEPEVSGDLVRTV